MSNNCKVPQVKPIVIKRFGTSGLVPTIPTTLDCNLWQKTDLKDGEFAVNTQDNKLYLRSGNQILELTNQSSGGGGTGSVTSVGLSMPSAFSVANSPITGSGTLVVTATGTTGEYIRGDGTLATFPSIPSFTPSALTKIDDTNVTLTLGGTPNTALLEATSITVGWSGQLAVSRGGTGAGTFTANNVLLGNGTSAFQTVAPGASGNILTSDGTTWVSQAPTGGGITINSTAITSGTVNRVLFEGAGNVVQQDAGFVWNNTDKRLILGADQASVDTNPRLVVVGKNPSGTTVLAAFHNSTGNSNALVIRDDGFVGFGALPFSSPFRYRFNFATNVNLSFSNPSGTITRITSSNDANTVAQQLNINVSTLVFEQAGIEYGRLDANEWRFQNRSFNINRNQAGGGETSILNLNNTGVQANATITLTYNINTTTPYVQLKGTIGALNTTASIYSIHVRNKASTALVEVARFTGNGGVIVGGTTENESSILDLQSTTKGFLPPRMTAAQRASISSPANGLLVIQTDGGAGVEGLWRYELSTTSWVRIG